MYNSGYGVRKDLVKIESSIMEDSSSITGKKSTRRVVIFLHDRVQLLHPNADEIAYLQRLVMYKDSAIIVLNKPPKLPVKGNLPVHNSMEALAAAHYLMTLKKVPGWS